MEVGNFFFQIYLHDLLSKQNKFLGSAFPITPNGDMLTCRHVVDLKYDTNAFALVIFDNEKQLFSKITEIIYPNDKELDIALLPNAIERSNGKFFPLLDPAKILVGEDVYSVGLYSHSSDKNLVCGYFKGNLVSVFKNSMKDNYLTFALSYPVIEGLSGSPVLTFHSGTKVVAMCYGSQQQRIIASEIIDYKDTTKEYKETINRIVEFGLAHHASTIIDFLKEKSVIGYIVTDNYIDIEKT